MSQRRDDRLDLSLIFFLFFGLVIAVIQTVIGETGIDCLERDSALRRTNVPPCLWRTSCIPVVQTLEGAVQAAVTAA